MWTLTVILSFILGISCGLLWERGLPDKEPVGTLQIEMSDPDGPYLFLEMRKDPRVLTNRKHVTLDVSTKSYISQE